MNMNSKVNGDIKSLKIIFNRNKFFITPVIITLVCIILFFQFVIPQIGLLLKAQDEFKITSLKLSILRNNLILLTNTSEDSLDSQLRILNLALPINKDFSGILDAIYYASQKTGVNLGSFSLKLGDLSKSESNDNFPIVKISIPISADISTVNNFLQTIKNTLPLSEVDSVKIGDTASTISLSFYYKPLGVFHYEADNRISPISQKGLSIINTLSSFENISSNR